MLLALVWMVFPSFPENVPFLGGMNILFTAAACVAFTYLVRRIAGLPTLAAAAVSGLVFLSAHLWRVAAVPLSEPLFLLTLLLALLAGSGMEKTPGRRGITWFLLGAGLTVYSRTLGVAVLGAGVVTLVLDRRFSAAAAAALGSVGLLTPWVIWTRWAGSTIPEPHQDILGSYTGWLVPQMVEGPGVFLSFVGGNALQMLGRMSTLLLPGWTGSAQLVGILLLPALAFGAISLFRSGRLIFLTLLFSLGILLVWPFQDVRLMVPFLPLLALVLVMGFQRLWVKEALPKPMRVGFLALGVLWAAAFAGVSASRLAGGWLQEGYRIRADALGEVVRAVAEKTPGSAVVGAPELWAGIHLFTGRSVIPSARFRPLSTEGPSQGTPEEQYAIWIEAGLTHVLVEHGGQVHGDALDRIDAMCEPGTVELVDNRPGRYLVALHWNRDCQDRVMGGMRPTTPPSR
jgi:hypothetical protein